MFVAKLLVSSILARGFGPSPTPVVRSRQHQLQRIRESGYAWLLEQSRACRDIPIY